MVMTHKISKADINFLSSFEKCEVEPDTFHHREHIKLAYILLVDNNIDEALVKLKTSLLKFLEFNGVGGSKYHETLSFSWLLAVKHFMHMSKSASCFEDFIESNRLLLNKNIMLTHYTQEILDSDIARREFVEPNLEPIPHYESSLANN